MSTFRLFALLLLVLTLTLRHDESNAIQRTGPKLFTMGNRTIPYDRKKKGLNLFTRIRHSSRSFRAKFFNLKILSFIFLGRDYNIYQDKISQLEKELTQLYVRYGQIQEDLKKERKERKKKLTENHIQDIRINYKEELRKQINKMKLQIEEMEENYEKQKRETEEKILFDMEKEHKIKLEKAISEISRQMREDLEKTKDKMERDYNDRLKSLNGKDQLKIFEMSIKEKYKNILMAEKEKMLKEGETIALSKFVEAKKRENALIERVRQELLNLRRTIKDRDYKIHILKSYLKGELESKSASRNTRTFNGGYKGTSAKSYTIHARKHLLNNVSHSSNTSAYKKV